jgi:hypothetical protein
VSPLGVAGRLSCRPVRRSSCRWGDMAACQLRACALDLVTPIQEGFALLSLLGDGTPDNSRRWKASEVRTPSLPLYGLSRCCVCKVDCCMPRVPVGMLLALAGVWGVTLAATPFAFELLVVGCGGWLDKGSVHERSVVIGPMLYRLPLFVPRLCSAEGG